MNQADEIFQRVERLDGPALIAYVVDDEADGTPLQTTESDWHRHVRGQLFYLERGVISVRTENGAWTLPPRRVGWMPPGELHTVRIAEATRGWGVHVAPLAAVGLPEKTCVLGVNDLMRALVLRASTWALQDTLSDEQERVLSVLMDEIRHAPVEPLHLNMPSDRRLLRIAHAVLDRPHDARSLDAWADWAGLSARTVSRLFRSETGCSFAQWRQQARLIRALERLACGEAVNSVADALGYASISAFVAMFRRSFGQPPGRYFAQHPSSTP
ncbi:AraC family transcriptional regulator [Dyella tabacisoli]|uniref:AraC family transcriptional regulator n=1 Tax=Dyella tabacisoli TaxID=2282381 RepID=A0A369UK34_9GAMM|nr:helix-turn-helix transcriptional regulator [Dyella tabacisoli]RDD80867.1 AraC family transcriptional regulator [Dyella tabacisoli]